MRSREMERFEAMHPDLAGRAAAWARDCPDGSLEDAVRELGVWHRPQDRDAQWLVWRALPAGAAARLHPATLTGPGHRVPARRGAQSLPEGTS
jgi:hypothetical protein